MAKTNEHQQTAALILALAPELALSIEEDRQKRLRSAAAMIRPTDEVTQRRLIAVVCATMRISDQVFRQILAE